MRETIPSVSFRRLLDARNTQLEPFLVDANVINCFYKYKYEERGGGK